MRLFIREVWFKYQSCCEYVFKINDFKVDMDSNSKIDGNKFWYLYSLIFCILYNQKLYKIMFNHYYFNKFIYINNLIH